MKSNIVLIGPPGSGKTCCGQALSRKLGYQFIDFDQLIESHAGMSVSEIFAQLGESHFRTLEKELLEKLIQDCLLEKVIATGGGTPIANGNFELLQALGQVVCLTASLQVLTDRLKQQDHRPMFKPGAKEPVEPEEHIKQTLSKLLQIRLPIYNQASLIVDTSILTADQVVNEVSTLLSL